MVSRIGVYAGTFDPIHNGHISIITRGLSLLDKLIVGVAHDSGKNTLFTLDERVQLIKEYFYNTPHRDKVIVEPFNGLLAEYAQQKNAIVILRGMRAISDFDYEFQMALMNRKLSPHIQTIFLMADFSLDVCKLKQIKNCCQSWRKCFRFSSCQYLECIKRKISKI